MLSALLDFLKITFVLIVAGVALVMPKGGYVLFLVLVASVLGYAYGSGSVAAVALTMLSFGLVIYVALALLVIAVLLTSKYRCSAIESGKCISKVVRAALIALTWPLAIGYVNTRLIGKGSCWGLEVAQAVEYWLSWPRPKKFM